MEIASTQTASLARASTGLSNTVAGGFEENLAVAASPSAGKADVTFGQLGVELDKGKPYAVVYFNEAGQKLTQTTFEPASILAKATEFGIPLSDLNGLADQLDAKGVSYKPYQLYSGTGSDHGIDLRDLASGGLGTAYDWRVDTNIGLKGKYAPAALLANQTLALQLGVTPSAITRPASTTPPSAADIDAANAIINGQVQTTPSAPIVPAASPSAGKADVTFGQLGVELDKGKPYAVVYFNEAGQKLTQTTFEPASILAKATEFGIPLSDLNGLADQLDAKGVSYKPYQLYSGTGSDHGIDLRDLASGGLGTAYDWRVDTNIGLKGKYAPAALLANQTLALQLGVTPSAITRPASTTPPSAADIDAANAIINGQVQTTPSAPIVPAASPSAGKADVTFGQLGVELDKGKPYAVVYFNEAGQKLTQTTFEPASILAKATEFGIPLSDLNGLADQLDAKGVSYKPYQLYSGTGSDHGIDLRDLASGGLGTAYDWRVDTNIGLKGKYAPAALLANQTLALQLGVTPSAITRPASTTPPSAADIDAANAIINGQVQTTPSAPAASALFANPALALQLEGGLSQPAVSLAQRRATALWADAVQQAADTDARMNG